jgi:hypothetical protein
VKLKTWITKEPELARPEVMGDKTHFVVQETNGIEVMNVAAPVIRIWRRVPPGPLPDRKIINSDQIIVRARHPQAVIKTSDPVDIAQGKWGMKLACFF